jgi:alcohol dehydrogenase class IV
VAALADELGIARPLVVTDQGVVAAGIADPVLEALPRAVLFADVRANPDVQLIDRAAGVYVEQGCDGLVAIGGGSAMDAAKAVGVVARHGGSIALC